MVDEQEVTGAELVEETEELIEEAESPLPESSYRFGRYYCDGGNHYTPFFVAKSDKSPFVRCPVCNARIGKRRVPPESIIVDSELFDMIHNGMHPRTIFAKAKEKGYIPEAVEVDELMEQINPTTESRSEPEPQATVSNHSDRDEEEKRPRKETPLSSLFQRPKTPCEVLEEVLTEFNLKKEFVIAVVRRCQRAGSLHPVELLHYLTSMKSGVKTQGEAQFIAEEYAAALRQEMEKAKQMNMPYPNIGITEPWAVQGTLGNPAVSRLLQLVPPDTMSVSNNPGPTVMPGATGPYPAQRGRYGPAPASTPSVQQVPPASNEVALLQGVAQLIQALMPRQQPPQSNDNMLVQMFQLISKQQEQLMQMILNQTQQQIQALARELGDSIKSLSKSFEESIKELSTLVKEAQSRKQVDPDLLRQAAQAEAEKKYLERLLQQREKEFELLMKKLDEQEKKIYEVIMQASKPAGEFQSDEARLVAQALQQAATVGHRLVDVLDKRQPIKVIVEALPYLMQMEQGGKPVPKKYEETTSTEIIEELEKMGLVEEEG